LKIQLLKQRIPQPETLVLEGAPRALELFEQKHDLYQQTIRTNRTDASEH
jgi:hypothetical protein